MRVRVVLDRILAEADARQARVVERRAVGAADVAAGRRRSRRRRRDPGTAPAPGARSPAAAGGPNTPAPRARPVPESMFRYASSFAYSGFWLSNVPKCCFTYACDPSSPSSSPLHSATRMVRRGATPIAFRIRAASIIVAQPIALSVAPVAECHESRCPPSITTSSFLSRAGNLRDRVVRGRPFRIHRVDDVDLELDRACRRRGCARCGRSPRCA